MRSNKIHYKKNNNYKIQLHKLMGEEELNLLDDD